MQSAIAVHCRVNGHHDVEGEGHGEDEIGLILDLDELLRLGVINAVICLLIIIVVS